MSSPAIVVADALTKYYGARLAVDRVSFEVRPREVMGLLGPNGSGKSTILRILTGFLRPSAGSAAVGGWDVVEHGLEARSQLGYVPEDVPLYPQMRVREFLEFMGSLRGLAPNELAGAVGDAVDRLALGSVRDVLIAKLSRGYRQRVAIAQALLGKPKLLVLDEPTNGLDPRQIIEVRELIRALAQELAVLVTSHILAEVEKVSQRVAILLDGRLLTVHALRGQDAAQRLRVRLPGADREAVEAALQSLPGARLVEAFPAQNTYLVEGADAADTVRVLVQAGIEVAEAVRQHDNLEDLFLRLTEGARA